MTDFNLSCSIVTLGVSAYAVGEFIGDEEIMKITTSQHNDRGGVDVTVILDDGAKLDFIHRGAYTLMVVTA
jgi:hypothetical protein